MKLTALLLLCLTATAQDYTIQEVVKNLIRVESDGNNSAVGDNGLAVGCLQTWPIMVKECNRIIGRNEFKLKDRLSRSRSKFMATVYLSRQYSNFIKRTGSMPTEFQLANSWNMGSIFRPMNRKYIVRYKLKKEI